MQTVQNGQILNADVFFHLVCVRVCVFHFNFLLVFLVEKVLHRNVYVHSL